MGKISDCLCEVYLTIVLLFWRPVFYSPCMQSSFPCSASLFYDELFFWFSFICFSLLSVLVNFHQYYCMTLSGSTFGFDRICPLYSQIFFLLAVYCVSGPDFRWKTSLRYIIFEASSNWASKRKRRGTRHGSFA